MVATQICLTLGHKVEGVHAPPHPLRSYTGSQRETGSRMDKRSWGCNQRSGGCQGISDQASLGRRHPHMERICGVWRAKGRSEGTLRLTRGDSTSKERKRSWPESEEGNQASKNPRSVSGRWSPAVQMQRKGHECLRTETLQLVTGASWEQSGGNNGQK